MLRPSRPMIRPFISSDSSWTTDTVVSAAWPPATRCMTVERMLRARRSASRRASSSTCRIRTALSWRSSSSSSLSRICFAWLDAEPGDPLELLSWRCRACLSSSAWCSRLRARSSSERSRRSSSASRTSRDCSFARMRSSARRELGPPFAQLVLDVAQGLGGRGRDGLGALLRPGSGSPPPSRDGAGARAGADAPTGATALGRGAVRWASRTTPPDTTAATTAASTISMSGVSGSPALRRARLSQLKRARVPCETPGCVGLSALDGASGDG